MRPIRGFNGVRQLQGAPAAKLDKSVLERLNADPARHENLEEAYRPENLLTYLAANPKYDAELNPDVLAAVTAIRAKSA